MPQPDQENPFEKDRYRDAEAQLGGADDVEKTTYVVGKGTDPRARKGTGPSARVPGHGAPGIVIGIIIAIVVLVAIAYLSGIGR
ncbi:MAG TPA: hypothetical protein VJU87_05965 [Gemmatimonadaceae bacterium]|nr:hypothetical protein [Gemmatimonadaceae bacterium]